MSIESLGEPVDWHLRALEAERRVEYLETELEKRKQDRVERADLLNEIRRLATAAAEAHVDRFAHNLIGAIREALEQ